MLKAGCVVLSVWSVLNLIPSSWIVVSILFRGGNAPGLYALLTQDQVRALAPDVLASANSIGVFANGLNVAYCLLFTIAVWKGLAQRIEWVFWALLASGIFALVAGVGADHTVGTQFPEVNLISALLLAVGLGCCAPSIFRSR